MSADARPLVFYTISIFDNIQMNDDRLVFPSRPLVVRGVAQRSLYGAQLSSGRGGSTAHDQTPPYHRTKSSGSPRVSVR